MENFVYESPTKIVFGKDQIDSLKTLLQERNVQRMLLVYGKKSIKTLGIYDKIQDIVSTLNIRLFEESGVRPNPELSSVISGRKTAIENGVDFILAVGGGSVIDCAKAIAFSVFKKEEKLWDVFVKKDVVNRALPLGVVVTLAATGSETNGNTVISNDELREKRSIKNDHLIPEFAIIDPSYTLNVPQEQTVAGSIDIMMHVFEQYFSPTKRTETSDYMSIGILRSVLENTTRYLNGENDYDTRANLSWASTIALNWILQQGKTGDWASHRLSYPPTSEYDLTHGFALSAIYPTWLKMAVKHNDKAMRPRLETLGRELFDAESAEETIGAIVELFQSWGAPTSLAAYGVRLHQDQIHRYAEQVTALGPIGNVFKIDRKLATTFYENT